LIHIRNERMDWARAEANRMAEELEQNERLADSVDFLIKQHVVGRLHWYGGRTIRTAARIGRSPRWLQYKLKQWGAPGSNGQ